MKRRWMHYLLTALCALLLTGMTVTGCSKPQEPAPAPPPQETSSGDEKAAPDAPETASEEEDEDKFGC